MGHQAPEVQRNLTSGIPLIRFDFWPKKEIMGQDTSFSLIEAEEITSKAEYFTNIVRKAAKKLPSNAVLDELKSLVYDFKDTMPVVLALRNRHLKDYHWKEIKEIIGNLNI